MSRHAPNLEDMQQELGSHPRFKAVNDALKLISIMKITGHLFPGKAKKAWKEVMESDDQAEIRRLTRAFEDTYKKNQNASPDSRELMLRNIVMHDKNTAVGDFWIIRGKKENSFVLLFIKLNKDKENVFASCEGEIDPPNFKLIKSALRKTWYESPSLQDCIEQRLLVDNIVLQEGAKPPAPKSPRV